jgi:hypothetical protein
MPRINEPNFKGLTGMLNNVSSARTNGKPLPSFRTGQNGRANGDAPDKKTNDGVFSSVSDRQRSQLESGKEVGEKLRLNPSKKLPRSTGTAEAAYKRGVPLVYQASDVTDDGGGVVIVLHGQNNKRASLIDRQSLNADESSKLASRSLIGLNESHSSKDYWDTGRVVVAAMFQIGYLVSQDKAMARHMLSNMSERERSFGCNGALEECLGQKPELLRAIIELGANPNEESFDDGMLPLEKAIRHNSKSTVEILLEKGARLDLDTSSSGLTPQEYAEKFGSIEVNTILAAWAQK